MAKQMIDIGLTDDDLQILNGDFAVVESTLQHQRQLLVNTKGSFKENPTICVGLQGYLLDEDTGSMLKEVRAQFQGDGMTINSLELTDTNKPVINANY